MGSSRIPVATGATHGARARATRAAAAAMTGGLLLGLAVVPVASAQSAAPPDAAASSAPDVTQVSPGTGGPTVPAVTASAFPRVTGTGGLFDAPTQVFTDHFDDQTAWFTGDRETDSFAYEGGAYVVQVKNDEGGSWVWRVLGDGHPVLRAKGSVQLSDGDGAGGYMCGAGDADPRSFIFGDVTSSAEWVMGTISGSTASVRARGPLPSGSDAVGAPVVVTLECAMTDAWRSRRDVGRWRAGGAGPAVR